jgi:hypothetical protein
VTYGSASDPCVSSACFRHDSERIADASRRTVGSAISFRRAMISDVVGARGGAKMIAIMDRTAHRRAGEPAAPLEL